MKPNLTGDYALLALDFVRAQHFEVRVGYDGVIARYFSDSRNRRRYVAVADRQIWHSVQTEIPAELLLATKLVDAGEELKSIEAWSKILDWFGSVGVRRRDTILAVGGSSISDMVGFAAASYLRGVSYINIPTTLIAQVDGSTGGKVALNSIRAKNAVGAFWHPSFSLVETRVLDSLDGRQWRSGLAEVVKVACIERSGALFRHLEALDPDPEHWRPSDVTSVVTHALRIKLAELEPDPFETDLKRSLNFGHTIGHALESATSYREYLHGEAVAIGMASAARYGLQSGLTDLGFLQRLLRLLERFGLPTTVERIDRGLVFGALQSVRLVRDGRILLTVPKDVGEFAYVDEVDDHLLARCIQTRSAEC